jgi:hypothetical protein
MPTTYIRNAGTWPKVKKAFIKNGGSWSEIKTIWVRSSGAWNKYFVNLVTVNVAAQNNVNLKTLYTNQTGESPSSGVSVLFNINGNIGSTSTGTASLITDTWPSGTEITINIGSGVYVAGAGGGTGSAGGDAISLGFNVMIINNGVIGGGGGSGGSVGDFRSSTGTTFTGSGGAGAGLVNGSLYNASAGTSYSYVYNARGDVASGTGGTGGSLGQAGSAGTYGGRQSYFPDRTVPPQAGGKAIALNNNTATISGSGQLLYTVS